MLRTLSSPGELRRLRHDLRTPINHILGFSQLIAEDTQNPQVASDLQRIKDAARNLLALIDENLRLDGEQPPEASTAAAEDKAGWLRKAMAADVAPREATQATLLVVDDNAVNRDFLSRWLNARGYSVVTAAGGKEALRLTEDGRIDMVLLDILMPEVSGFDVLQALRRTHSVAELPIIMVTSMAESQDTVRFLQLGANDYVTKPIDLPILQARIETHLTVKRLSQLKDEFVGIASHDLKNPLSVVVGYLHLLQEEGLSEECAGYVRILMERATCMERIISDFLDFQVLNAGGLALETCPLDLADLAREALENQACSARAKTITTELRHEGRRVLVEADLARIQQVVDNLVSNAIKFSGRKSHVVVQTRCVDGEVELSVTDSGPGLRDDDFAKLFVRYARLSNRPTGDESSTGVGLSICKQIVDLHHGSIGARNNPQCGATFWFRLPGAQQV